MRGIGKQVENVSHHTIKNYLNSIGYDTSKQSKNYSSRQVLTNSQILEMSDMYRQGKSLRSIGVLFGIDHNTVKKYILATGTKPHEIPKINEQEVVETYLRTRSLEKAGRAVGIGTWAAKTILTRHNVEIFIREPSLKWKVDDDGYTVRYNPESIYSNNSGFERQHRTVMGEHLGRRLESYETVHHINGNRADNRLENLQLRMGSHGPGAIYVCNTCGSTDISNNKIKDFTDE